ncbi:MAG: hypothetical protein ACRC9N_09460 [Aeromonas sp.]
MPEQLPQQAKCIRKSDLFSGAVITSIITFLILTWSKTLPADSAFAPYVTEQTISFVAGLSSYFITIGLTFIQYNVSLTLYKRDYTKKVKYLDQIMEITTCPKAKKLLEEQKNILLIKAAKSIIEEKI